MQAELLPVQEEQVPANTLSRRRQLDGDDDAEPRVKRARTTQPTSEPARLTRQNLAHFNKMGNNHNGSEKGFTSHDSSSSTKTLSTTASGFAVRAKKNGILDPIGSKPPTNLEAVCRRLARRRATVSPSESAYRGYTNTIARAANEATIVVTASRKLLEEYSDEEGYINAYNQAFTDYPKDVGFNNGLSAPQPDFVQGFEAEEYDPFPISHIPSAVLCKDNPRSITLPHIAGEWKGRGGNMAEAEVQAAYDGAALVYARNQALDTVKEPCLAGHANVTTFTSDGANLNLFAHYATEKEDGTLQYHQYPIESLNLVRSYEGYKEGRKYLRNAQDLAREESYALRDKLKDHWRQSCNNLPSISEGVAPLSFPDLERLYTTHVYEDEDD